MQNPGLDEAQAGIKISGRNINNLTYKADTILMEESEEELKSLLVKMKEESEKVGLKFSIQKTKLMVCRTIISWQIDGETMETVTLQMMTATMKLKDACSLEEAVTTLDRQNIKKQRYYFAYKGPSSQSYGFSSSHVWMWELGNKEV